MATLTITQQPTAEDDEVAFFELNRDLPRKLAAIKRAERNITLNDKHVAGKSIAKKKTTSAESLRKVEKVNGPALVCAPRSAIKSPNSI